MGLSDRAAIILAGGDGTRLREYIREIAGCDIPKQFFGVTGDASLLELTRRRAAASVEPLRTFFALNREHEEFFSPLLSDVRRENLVVQPGNRGTAPAILYSLMRVAQVMPHASVVLMPSDHFVGNEPALSRHLDAAFETVELRPEMTVLLGAAPDGPETAYGWIEPGPPVEGVAPEVFRVHRFVEKPSCRTAADLMARGCLWNSFIVVARVPALLGLFMVAAPELYLSFWRMKSSFGTALESERIGGLYKQLEASDFSRQVLEQAAINMCVLRMSDIGWCDLGDRSRVAKVLARSAARRGSRAA